MAKGNKFRPLPPNFPAFIGITDPDLAQWVQARLTPHPISTYEDPPPTGGKESKSVPKSFINCIKRPYGAPLFATFATRALSLAWKVHELKAGHAAMLTNPKELADILLRLADM